MADVTRIQRKGSLLHLHYSDGKTRIATPTLNDVWLVPHAKAPTPDPEPNPGNGGGGGGTTPPKDDGTWMWPFQYSRYVLAIPEAQFGPRVHPIYGTVRNHLGLDFGGGGINGQAIPCAAAGTVINAGYNGAMGNNVWVQHPGGVVTKYFHMVTTPPVRVGQAVKKGQTLGNVDTTGASTGAHLHWETHVNGTPVNPRDFMKSVGMPET
ncbi:hypothetical protein QEJ61_gp12 [Curtobacterium phage Pize]|uniref:hypothetical protein n=1 Tax=Curtobacterium phage Pize TaxID=2851068 RepID=UPI0022028D75|nr:hypothetical protein QEJ61_gp12 [Curtobacterium phage Pize]QXG07744.1 hypothetical protein [Curtobacterium phage Pize]